jgi:DNA-binding transcriptional regulator YdaS (Cro superfamily)
MMTKSIQDQLTSVRVARVAEICGITRKAVYGWIARGRLPRTEYTKETNYAEKIEKATSGAVTAHELLNPKTPTEAA